MTNCLFLAMSILVIVFVSAWGLMFYGHSIIGFFGMVGASIFLVIMADCLNLLSNLNRKAFYTVNLFRRPSNSSIKDSPAVPQVIGIERDREGNDWLVMGKKEGWGE